MGVEPLFCKSLAPETGEAFYRLEEAGQCAIQTRQRIRRSEVPMMQHCLQTQTDLSGMTYSVLWLSATESVRTLGRGHCRMGTGIEDKLRFRLEDQKNNWLIRPRERIQRAVRILF